MRDSKKSQLKKTPDIFGDLYVSESISTKKESLDNVEVPINSFMDEVDKGQTHISRWAEMILHKYDILLDRHLCTVETNRELKEQLEEKDLEIERLTAQLHERDYEKIRKFRRQQGKIHMNEHQPWY